MALWIRADVEGVAVTTHVTPADGKRFTLAELQRYVGGFIEALHLGGREIMWLNEEGKLKDLPYNAVADVIAHKRTGIADWDSVVGDVLVASYAESAEGDDEEED